MTATVTRTVRASLSDGPRRAGKDYCFNLMLRVDGVINYIPLPPTIRTVSQAVELAEAIARPAFIIWLYVPGEEPCE